MGRRHPLTPGPSPRGEGDSKQGREGAAAAGRTPRTAGRLAAWALLLAVGVAGCTKYPQVGFENLKYVAALRTACSAKNEDWLAEAKAAIEKEHSAGTMGDEEYAAYGGIVAAAEAGEWAEAEAECVRFQKDQLAE